MVSAWWAGGDAPKGQRGRAPRRPRRRESIPPSPQEGRGSSAKREGRGSAQALPSPRRRERAGVRACAPPSFLRRQEPRLCARSAHPVSPREGDAPQGQRGRPPKGKEGGRCFDTSPLPRLRPNPTINCVIVLGPVAHWRPRDLVKPRKSARCPQVPGKNWKIPRPLNPCGLLLRRRLANQGANFPVKKPLAPSPRTSKGRTVRK